MCSPLQPEWKEKASFVLIIIYRQERQAWHKADYVKQQVEYLYAGSRHGHIKDMWIALTLDSGREYWQVSWSHSQLKSAFPIRAKSTYQ